MECLVPAGASLGRHRLNRSIALTVRGIKNLGYIEVEPFNTTPNHHKISVDLVRLRTSGKNAFGTYNSQNFMTMQAVGMSMTFYLMQRTTKELYTMFELEHIRFPPSMDEVTMMLGLMDKVMGIVQVFRTYCITYPEQTSITGVTKETLNSPILRVMTTAAVCRKRKILTSALIFKTLSSPFFMLL